MKLTRIKMKPDKEKIVLFDMDGTLTAPRGPVEAKVIHALRELAKLTRIGIVTGSDYDYVMQQMSAAFDISGIPMDAVDILPCNGTKKYVASKSGEFNLESEANMMEKIGHENHRKLIKFCLDSQSKIVEKFPDIPYTGTFIQYRGSLLNWCPVGRSADNLERKKFVDVDTKEGIRSTFMSDLQALVQESKMNVTVALGGSTSLDIYPTGWDKTYALSRYPDHDVWFVGDRCEEGGNDWHIYEALKDDGRSFHVHSPTETVSIINEIISSFE